MEQTVKYKSIFYIKTSLCIFACDICVEDIVHGENIVDLHILAYYHSSGHYPEKDTAFWRLDSASVLRWNLLRWAQ
jgi:hypothetical protein